MDLGYGIRTKFLIIADTDAEVLLIDVPMN